MEQSKTNQFNVLAEKPVGSLLMQYRKTVDTKEADFWLKLAKRESFFDVDRNKTYKADSEETAE